MLEHSLTNIIEKHLNSNLLNEFILVEKLVLTIDYSRSHQQTSLAHNVENLDPQQGWLETHSVYKLLPSSWPLQNNPSSISIFSGGLQGSILLHKYWKSLSKVDFSWHWSYQTMAISDYIGEACSARAL